MNFFELYRTMKEHVGAGGVQRWSAGEIFPYTIKVVGHGPGKVVLWHPEQGDVKEFPFTSMEPGGDFGDAHKAAEQLGTELLWNTGMKIATLPRGETEGPRHRESPGMSDRVHIKDSERQKKFFNRYLGPQS